MQRLFAKTPAAERFIDLADGRTLFLPHGRGGAVYLVPDDETRVRLLRRFKVVDRIAGLAFAAGAVIATMLRAWTLMPFLILLGLLLPRWMERVALESLPEAHDPDALRAAGRYQVEPSSVATHLAALAAGAGLAVYGYLRFNARDAIDHLATLALLGGAWLVVTTLRGWGDERPQEYFPPGHAQPDNTPIEPRYH